MKKITQTLLLRAVFTVIGAMFSLCVTNSYAIADEVTGLLKDADQFRVGSDHIQIGINITTLNRDGSLDKERQYLAFQQGYRQSLVLMQSPAEKGQKVLMLGDDFWMMLPGSQRPMRITPMQKLLGDASIGDIAQMRWSQDYDGQLIGEEKCDEKNEKNRCFHLTLKAKQKSSSYQRIELWIAKGKHEPVKADLYVQSEKLAKQAIFILNKTQTPNVISDMVLLDQLSSHKETRVHYLGRKNKTIPEQWLNPMFLAKNPSLE